MSVWLLLLLSVNHQFFLIKCVCVWRGEECVAGWDSEVELIRILFSLSALNLVF